MKKAFDFLIKKGIGNTRLGPNYNMSDLLDEYHNDNLPHLRKIDPEKLPKDDVVVITTDRAVVTAKLYKDSDNRVIALCSRSVSLEYSPAYYITKEEFFKIFYD